jgi:putative phosphoesterase
MLVCLMSDIHGNLPALEKVLTLTKEVELYVSLGDVVNYAPWSNDCVDLLESLDNKILLRGNHEENFLKKKYPGKNLIASEFHKFCIGQFNRFNEIENYELSAHISDYYLTHTVENMYVFDDTSLNINSNVILGHSHKQFVTSRNSFTLVNPGSVGQNRQFVNVINYIIWDTIKNTFECKSVEYNVDSVIEKMIQLRYPDICINYYKNKKRL